MAIIMKHKNGQQLQVDFTDLVIAAILFESVFVESLHHGDDADLETREIVKRLSRISGNPVSAIDLAKELNISKDIAYTKLRLAQQSGVIRRVNKPEKSNRKLFLPVARPRFLPDPRELFDSLPELGKEVRFVHPLTNQWVIYRRADRKRSR